MFDDDDDDDDYEKYGILMIQRHCRGL